MLENKKIVAVVVAVVLVVLAGVGIGYGVHASYAKSCQAVASEVTEAKAEVAKLTERYNTVKALSTADTAEVDAAFKNATIEDVKCEGAFPTASTDAKAKVATVSKAVESYEAKVKTELVKARDAKVAELEKLAAHEAVDAKTLQDTIAKAKDADTVAKIGEVLPVLEKSVTEAKTKVDAFEKAKAEKAAAEAKAKAEAEAKAAAEAKAKAEAEAKAAAEAKAQQSRQSASKSSSKARSGKSSNVRKSARTHRPAPKRSGGSKATPRRNNGGGRKPSGDTGEGLAWLKQKSRDAIADCAASGGHQVLHVGSGGPFYRCEK